MTVYATLTREYLDPRPDKLGRQNFVWYAEKDNYNDGTVVLNQPYLKTKALDTRPKKLVIRKVYVVQTGTEGIAIAGALCVGPPAASYVPWPLEKQLVIASGEAIVWDFGDGISMDPDPTITAAVNIIVLSITGYAAADDMDIGVEGYIEA